MIPITKPYFDDMELKNITKCLQSGWLTQGVMVEEFEKRIAEHENVKYAVATSNCTTALHLALVAHEIKVGHDVIVPSYTYVATANAVMYTGATPIFSDIYIDSFNISIDYIKGLIENNYKWDNKKECMINNKSNNILKAIIPVHLFGLCADMNQINMIAKKYNLIILEDSACALGAKIDNICEGNFGNTSCLSFHPRKSITTGEGGIILTNDENFCIKLKELRSHGVKTSDLKRHNSDNGSLLPSIETIGYNYRMSDVQGAIGVAQVNKLDFILEKRREKAFIYDKLLKNLDWIVTPKSYDNYYHTYQSYVCLIKNESLQIEKLLELRDNIMKFMKQKQIQVRQGTYAIHILDVYKNLYNHKYNDFENSFLADKLSISLPIFVEMDLTQQQYIVNCLSEAYQSYIK